MPPSLAARPSPTQIVTPSGVVPEGTFGALHQLGVSFDTTGSSPFSFATIPTSEGYSYFIQVWLSSADVAGAEANECVSFSRAVYTFAPSKSLALRDSSIILQSSSAVVPVFAVSGSNILLQADPIDGTDRRHHGHLFVETLPLERYPS